MLCGARAAPERQVRPSTSDRPGLPAGPLPRMTTSGALFPSLVPGSRGSSNKYLVEFRAGKMSLKGTTVTPDKRKGLVYIQQTDDSLIHFCWKDRTSGNVEDVSVGAAPPARPHLAPASCRPALHGVSAGLLAEGLEVCVGGCCPQELLRAAPGSSQCPRPAGPAGPACAADPEGDLPQAADSVPPPPPPGLGAPG